MQTLARLTVDVSRLAKTGERLAGLLERSVLDLGATDGLITPAGELRYDLRVERIGDELLVRGVAAIEAACVCSRCAEPFRTQVQEPAFVASYPLEETTEFVDLTPDLREAIILLLPGYPVCREACRGLCPQCGTNLNHASCRCKSSDEDSRWAALDVLGIGRGRTGGARVGKRAGTGAGKSNKAN